MLLFKNRLVGVYNGCIVFANKPIGQGQSKFGGISAHSNEQEPETEIGNTTEIFPEFATIATFMSCRLLTQGHSGMFKEPFAVDVP